jgi:hypothetical protein
VSRDGGVLHQASACEHRRRIAWQFVEAPRSEIALSPQQTEFGADILRRSDHLRDELTSHLLADYTVNWKPSRMKFEKKNHDYVPAALVLGDTPLPQSDLGRGFSVPLSRSLAVLAVPTGTRRPYWVGASLRQKRS